MKKLSELTPEETQSLEALHKLQLETLTKIGQLALRKRALETEVTAITSALEVLYKDMEVNIPEKENQFKRDLTDRLGLAEWVVFPDGSIFEEEK